MIINSIQEVFDNKDLRDYIFSFLYSFDRLIETDNVYIFELHKHDPNFIKLINEDTFDTAAEYESLNLLKWLHYNTKIGCTEYAMNIAADSGNLEIIEFLHNNRDEGCSREALIYASENDHLDIIIWLHENQLNNIEFDSYKNAIDNAVINDNLEMIEYLYDNYKTRYNNTNCFSTKVIHNAIQFGNLEIIKWLHERCKYFSYKEQYCAAKYGHKDILKWLHKNRTFEILSNRPMFELIDQNPWPLGNDRSIVCAAESGHLDIVKYLIKF